MNVPWWRTDAIDWNANGWTLAIRDDELAEIRHHGTPVLRAVRAVVRDDGWQTVPVRVRGIDLADESLQLTLEHAGLGARISSRLSVQARPGELSIDWVAVSETAFATCRTGLVVLHPWTDAGREAIVVHSDGSTQRTRFPREISPHQPMRDIRELHLDDDTVIAFGGDVFEMEDQRNWTDASFKTYSRPLDLPFPYALAAGESLRQSITLTAPPGAPTSSAPQDLRTDPAVIRLIERGAFPAIGVEAATSADPVPASDIGAFRIVELDLATPSWGSALARASLDDRPLDVRLVTDGDPHHLADAADALRGRSIVRITAFDPVTHITTPGLVTALRSALGDAGRDVPIMSGARSHFTELNREQDAIARDVDAITFTTTPLFHSLDSEQLVEAISMQRLVAEQSVTIAQGRDVHIGPVALRPRYNNVATTSAPSPTRSDLSEGYGAAFAGTADERQRAPQLGAWVVASAAAMAVPGVRSLSWFETWGARGIADASGRAPAADAIDALEGCTLLRSSDATGMVWALGGRRDRASVVLVANLDRVERTVEVRIPDGSHRRIVMTAGSWRRLTWSSR